jgi:fructose-1,6-bisphosphatase I
MGTVFGVYASPTLPVSGRDLVAAGFVLYGPITTLVLAEDDTAREFVVEDGTLLDGGRVELPEDPVVYGFGGRAPDWTPDFAAYVDEVADELKLRYGGAMIADVSQVLTYGGVFGYPHLQSAPNGKLRLLFEAAPVGFVVEAAGGASSDGTRSLLDIDCTAIHQRTPVFVGSPTYVERLEDALPSQ